MSDATLQVASDINRLDARPPLKVTELTGCSRIDNCCVSFFRYMEITLDCAGKTHPAFKMKKKQTSLFLLAANRLRLKTHLLCYGSDPNMYFGFLKGLGKRRNSERMQ